VSQQGSLAITGTISLIHAPMTTSSVSPGPPRLLERLGLHRPELRAWAMYDWANSAMVVVVMTTIFPIFFSRFVSPGTAEEATQDLAIANSVAMAIVAVLAPILGALSDYSASKKRFLGISMGIGVAAVASMFFIRQGDVGLAATLFVIAIIGATGSSHTLPPRRRWIASRLPDTR
jgi:UMF1 family MFS transporter